MYMYTVYSGYSGHVYSGHSDIVATFPVTKYIYSFIFRSDIVARKCWPKVATISEVHCIYIYNKKFDAYGAKCVTRSLLPLKG